MITLLVVLYNRHIMESETLQSISEWSYTHKKKISEIIIWNNSSFMLTSIEIDAFSSKFPNSTIQHIGDGINHPLSEIYNHVIKNLNPNGWLILFDHDSIVSDNYIDEINSIISKPNCPNLILPQIYYNSTLVSPAKQFYFLGTYLSSIKKGLHNSKFMTAINSGMCINTNYLKNVYKGYNEKIKFYGTDNDFMWKYSLDNKTLYVMEERICHTLNFYEDSDDEKIKSRFLDIKNGLMENMRQINPILVPLANIYWFYFSIKFNIRNWLCKKRTMM